jgi:hypothetical protein
MAGVKQFDRNEVLDLCRLADLYEKRTAHLGLPAGGVGSAAQRKWMVCRPADVYSRAVLAELRHKQEAMVIGQVIGGDRLELDLPAQVNTRFLIQKN